MFLAYKKWVEIIQAAGYNRACNAVMQILFKPNNLLFFSINTYKKGRYINYCPLYDYDMYFSCLFSSKNTIHTYWRYFLDMDEIFSHLFEDRLHWVFFWTGPYNVQQLVWILSWFVCHHKVFHNSHPPE